MGEKGLPGDKGPTGDPGPVGRTGLSAMSGTDVPTASTGKDGDTYIHVTTGDVYARSAGVWSNVGNIKGPPGPSIPYTIGLGVADIPQGVMLGGNTRNVVVTLDRTMPSDQFVPFVDLSAPATVLGNVTYSIVAQTTTTVTVAVKNTSLLTLGPSIRVNVQAVIRN